MSGRADIAWSRQLSGTSPGQVAQWALAAFVMLAAHAGAGWWALRERPVQAADNAPPPAIMIDLAPMAMAPDTVEEILTEDEVAQDFVDAPPTLEPLEPEEEVAEAEMAEPVETVELAEPVEEEPETIQAEPEAIEPIAEIPEPVVRPKAPPPPRAQQKKPPKPNPKPPVPAPQKTKAQIQAPEAPRVAAPRTSSGGAAALSPARWESRLLAHLERRKRYPPAARQQRQEGVAQVRFSIDAAGNVLSVSLARSSGAPLLDQEVVAMVRRASPVPAPPPGVSHTITVPVRFFVR